MLRPVCGRLDKVASLFLYVCVPLYLSMNECLLSYDVTSGSEITLCNKMDKPLVVNQFTGNVIQ